MFGCSILGRGRLRKYVSVSYISCERCSLYLLGFLDAALTVACVSHRLEPGLMSWLPGHGG